MDQDKKTCQFWGYKPISQCSNFISGKNRCIIDGNQMMMLNFPYRSRIYLPKIICRQIHKTQNYHTLHFYYSLKLWIWQMNITALICQLIVKKALYTIVQFSSLFQTSLSSIKSLQTAYKPPLSSQNQ